MLCMRVGLITVGDELLAGDTVNTNAAWLARELDQRGVDVERIVVVPDREQDIAQAVNIARAEFDAVLVTGGLGPTHDDVTMEGVAAAVGRDVVDHPDAIDWFTDHAEYQHADLVDGTTELPAESRMLPNTEGVAPGAVVEADDGIPIYVLPGVPEEMKAMFSLIADELSGPQRTREFIDTSEPESGLIDRLDQVREKFDVSIGSYPGADGVTIKVESKDAAAVKAASEWLREQVE